MGMKTMVTLKFAVLLGFACCSQAIDDFEPEQKKNPHIYLGLGPQISVQTYPRAELDLTEQIGGQPGAKADKSVESPFNCRTRESWSEEKQVWCCANQGLGCPEPTNQEQKSTSVADRYDCRSRDAWTEDRRAWCCANKKRGCLSTAKKQLELFDCEASQTLLDDEHRAWCCSNKGIGCLPTLMRRRSHIVLQAEQKSDHATSAGSKLSLWWVMVQPLVLCLLGLVA
eukprot:c7331_g1_i1.p1 GENE.c7331_g1_i1~~c7331_g1_i1.p1  ORF type:complete len:227 (-),score=30.17 c7331_g1_i1:101-781(-)